MERTVNSEPLAAVEGARREPPLVFLDTEVIFDYLHGEPSAVQLFAAEAEGHVRFAINPIVGQELLLGAVDSIRPRLGQILDRLKILPVNLAKAEKLSCPRRHEYSTKCLRRLL